MNCNFKPNSTVIPGVKFGQFVDGINCPPTYLRPDPGGTLVPWLYALFLLFFHLPACIIRALRWESAQYLALGLALFSVALCIQSYLSTGLDAGEVLVWMPLTLMLDIGAMMQIVVLIIEEHTLRRLGGAIAAFLRLIWVAIAVCGHKLPPPRGDQLEVGIVGGPVIPNRLPTPPPRCHDGADQKAENNLLAHSFVCLAAFTLFLALVILQIYGLVAAVRATGEADIANLTVKWCSPSFRDFAIAVATGNCEKYNVTSSSSNGIGCISLPARQQRDWLTGTIVGLGAALVLQAVDMVLMRCARDRRCRGVEMQRPWFTMFGGTLMLVILVAFGVFNAARLPSGVTDAVWIYHKEPRATVGRVCQAKLQAPGLRGMIIGWTDAVFSGWGDVYYGA
ncbi:hypothetical protein FOCG_15188 [Fusarium oxysporum f. sp. radicis-lycopersici 26381]|nr:hypothetical protein FOCG_15188 [Fusarium oxysporum f. sp. radicis-lycopersici 26381]